MEFFRLEQFHDSMSVKRFGQQFNYSFRNLLSALQYCIYKIVSFKTYKKLHEKVEVLRNCLDVRIGVQNKSSKTIYLI